MIAFCRDKDTDLRNLRNNELADRGSAAAGAKAILLKAYRAAKEIADPKRLARHAERVSLVKLVVPNGTD